MTRKDYIIIARALRASYTNATETHQSPEVIEAILKTAFTVCSELAEDSARFNGWHFMDVVRGNKSLESHPPRADGRTVTHGRITPERAARVIGSCLGLAETRKAIFSANVKPEVSQ